MKSVWVAMLASLLALTPAAGEATPDKASTGNLDQLFEQASKLQSEISPNSDSFTPLYGTVTREITGRISSEVAFIDQAAPGRPVFALPTVGRACLTTAPNCGRPTAVGCKPRATLNCNQTTAITCGCRATQNRCQPQTTAPNCGNPPPPQTTAPNCGRPAPATTAPNCGQPRPQPQPGPGPATTAPNCR